MRQFDPIFFTEPTGSTRRPRTLFKGGGGGGDGGAAKREAAEKARVAAAVKRINQIFAVEKNAPRAVDANAFYADAKYDRRGNIINSNGMEVQDIPKSGRNNNMYGGVNNQFGGPVNMYGGLDFGGRGSQRSKRLFNRSAYDRAVADAAAEAARLDQEALAAREGTYKKIGSDYRNKAVQDLNKEREITQRDLGFLVARQGLSGGSRDVDVNREILDTHQKGLLRAADMGTQAENNARSADDRTRVDLITAINAGLDEGSAMQQAYEGMANNARSAQDEANLASLSGFFDTLKAQQQAAAYQNGFAQTVAPNQTKTNAAIYGRTGKSSYSGNSGGKY